MMMMMRPALPPQATLLRSPSPPQATLLRSRPLIRRRMQPTQLSAATSPTDGGAADGGGDPSSSSASPSSTLSSEAKRAVDRSMAAIALPALAGLTIDPIASLVDTAMVGRFCAAADLAGAGVASA